MSPKAQKHSKQSAKPAYGDAEYADDLEFLVAEITARDFIAPYITMDLLERVRAARKSKDRLELFGVGEEVHHYCDVTEILDKASLTRVERPTRLPAADALQLA